MRYAPILIAATASLALVAACSPKTEEAADNAASNAAAATSDTAATASAGATGAGGAVSPPQENQIVDADPSRGTATAAGSNSFTEAQARAAIEKAGFTDVSGLAKTADGLWTASAKKGGKTSTVALDFKGDISMR